MRTRGTAVLAAGCAVHVTCAAYGALVWLGLRMCTGVARAIGSRCCTREYSGRVLDVAAE